MSPVLCENELRQKVLILALGLATFIQVLDVSIANVALPRITSDFGVVLSDGAWVITAFTASNGVAILMAGWLANRFGEARVFVGSALAFALTSLLCGFSWSFETLVVARCLQGLSAGPILPLAQGILVRHFPVDRRVWALSVWTAVAVAAPLFGPLVGGLIVDGFDWEWIFLINVPFALCSVYLFLKVFEPETTVPAREPFDWIGLLAIVVVVALLQMAALDWTLPVLSLAILFLIRWESRVANPIVDPAVCSNRGFMLGTAVISVGYAFFYCNLVLVPIWLQNWKGCSATTAGLVTMPIGLAPLCLSSLFARWINRLDFRIWGCLSFLGFAVTSLYLGYFAPVAELLDIAFFRLIQGFALTLFYVPLLSIATASLPVGQINGASALITFVRYAMASLAVPLALAFCDGRAEHYSLAGGLGGTFPPDASLPFSRAVGDFYLLSAFAYLLMCFLVFRLDAHKVRK